MGSDRAGAVESVGIHRCRASERRERLRGADRPRPSGCADPRMRQSRDTPPPRIRRHGKRSWSADNSCRRLQVQGTTASRPPPRARPTGAPRFLPPRPHRPVDLPRPRYASAPSRWCAGPSPPRYPSSAPHCSMYRNVCFTPSSTVHARLFRSESRNTFPTGPTADPARAATAPADPSGPGPTRTPRSMRPPPFTTRCRYDCIPVRAGCPRSQEKRRSDVRCAWSIEPDHFGPEARHLLELSIDNRMSPPPATG